MKLLYIFSSVFFKDTLHYVLPSYTHPTAGSAVPCPYSSTLQLGLEIVCRLLGCLSSSLPVYLVTTKSYFVSSNCDL